MTREKERIGGDQRMNGETRVSLSRKMKVTIIGGGLVGSLSACFFARRGHEVHLYEYRDDIRSLEHVQGRSINLSLSTRGRSALRMVGLEDEVIKRHGIPMYARMIHDKDGTRRPIPYGKTEQCIYSVGRRYLNELLLTAAEKYPSVHLHFCHKLVAADLKKGSVTLQQVTPGHDIHPDACRNANNDAEYYSSDEDSSERNQTKPNRSDTVTATADLVIGADGAYSAVRRQMVKQPLFDFSQTYIPHGYLELCIPPTKDGKFAMEANYLHIWPRGQFMMIALPNQDCSWTVTLFMPFDVFSQLDTPQKLINFFSEHYPDSIPLLGEKKLIEDYFATKPSPLVSIKCKPYHVGSSSVIIGDAAHAMVPFYGQGMNAGFEDCLILDELMQKHQVDLSRVLPEFSEQRNPDAEAICDLAMYNYVEMRDLVNRPSFLIRKRFDNLLYTLLPNTWVPLYPSVTFTRMPYKMCIKNRKWQDKVISVSMTSAGAMAVLVVLAAAARWQEHLSASTNNLFLSVLDASRGFGSRITTALKF